MGVNPKSLIVIGRYAMEITGKTKLKGAEKKKLVISMLTKIVEETELSEENKVACMALVDGGVIESTIDLVIEVSKGKIKFNKKGLKRIIKTLKPIFNCLRSVLAAPRRHPSVPVVEVAAVEVEVVEVPAAEEEDENEEVVSAAAEASVSEEASAQDEEVVAET